MNDFPRNAIAILLTFLALSVCNDAFPHEVRPAYLQIAETSPGRFDVLWKKPSASESAPDLVPTLSNGLLDSPPDQEYFAGNHVLRIWKHRRLPHGAFDQATLHIDGLERSLVNVFFDLRLAGGQHVQALLAPVNALLTIDVRASNRSVQSYLRLGMEHILTGFDHLSFVLALVLLVRQRWRLLRTITAFTFAHSITLGGSVLGYVESNAPVVETLVGITIVLVAVEVIRFHRGDEGMTSRHPEILACVFGLLHGFAFAGSLVDIGLPIEGVVGALFLFNCGVELGQIIFIGIACVLMEILRRSFLLDHGSRVLAYGIGTLACYWTFQRIDVVIRSAL